MGSQPERLTRTPRLQMASGVMTCGRMRHHRLTAALPRVNVSFEVRNVVHILQLLTSSSRWSATRCHQLLISLRSTRFSSPPSYSFSSPMTTPSLSLGDSTAAPGVICSLGTHNSNTSLMVETVKDTACDWKAKWRTILKRDCGSGESEPVHG